jgi:hypothetical protein
VNWLHLHLRRQNRLAQTRLCCGCLTCTAHVLPYQDLLQSAPISHQNLRFAIRCATGASPALLQHVHSAPRCCCLEPAAEHVYQLGVRLGQVKRSNLQRTAAVPIH